MRTIFPPPTVYHSAAVRFGAASGSVTDIFLPRWFAHNLPAIHVPLIVLAMGLHLRNLGLRPHRGGQE